MPSLARYRDIVPVRYRSRGCGPPQADGQDPCAGDAPRATIPASRPLIVRAGGPRGQLCYRVAIAKRYTGARAARAFELRAREHLGAIAANERFIPGVRKQWHV